jgi:hypothetical protein
VVSWSMSATKPFMGSASHVCVGSVEIGGGGSGRKGGMKREMWDEFLLDLPYRLLRDGGYGRVAASSRA